MNSRDSVNQIPKTTQLPKRKYNKTTPSFLEKKMELCENDARDKARKKDKRGAMQALKRKQLMETQIKAIENQIMTLEMQSM
jgi:hypothetical protein